MKTVREIFGVLLEIVCTEGFDVVFEQVRCMQLRVLNEDGECVSILEFREPTGSLVQDGDRVCVTSPRYGGANILLVAGKLLKRGEMGCFRGGSRININAAGKHPAISIIELADLRKELRIFGRFPNIIVEPAR